MNDLLFTLLVLAPVTWNLVLVVRQEVREWRALFAQRGDQPKPPTLALVPTNPEEPR